MILLLTSIRPPFFFMLRYSSGSLLSYGSHNDNNIRAANGGGDCSIVIHYFNADMNGGIY